MQVLAVVVLTSLEDVGVRGMKHEITMGNICSSNNNNKVLYSDKIYLEADLSFSGRF